MIESLTCYTATNPFYRERQRRYAHNKETNMQLLQRHGKIKVEIQC